MTEAILEMQVDALNDLLDAERAALLAGDLNRLTEMYEPKETLIEAMNGTGAHDAQSLRMLDNKVKRNQLLLDGALEGIRKVAKRMAELRRIRRSLDTYGADGRKRSIGMSNDATLEKRA